MLGAVCGPASPSQLGLLRPRISTQHVLRSCPLSLRPAKQLHPGNANTLPNFSLFPPVAMATCDLAEFLGELPAFSAETKVINTVFLMPTLSAGPWSHLGLGPVAPRDGSCPWAVGLCATLQPPQLSHVPIPVVSD